MNKNPNDSKKIDNPELDDVRIRPCRLEDLTEINNLLARVHFDVGVHIMQLYFTNSEQLWKVAVNEKNEIIGFDSGHVLPVKGIQFGFDMYIRDDYQNRGIVRRFGIVYGTEPIAGNATQSSMSRISQFDAYDIKLLGYNGEPALGRFQIDLTHRDYSTFDVSPLNDRTDMKNLFQYDRSIFDIDRSQFIREWCTTSKSNQPYARTLIAKRKSDGRILGFGTIRLFSDFYGIMPLYADDQTIARRILYEIVDVFVRECKNEHLYVFFNAKNRLMMEFVHRLKFELADSEMRQYSRGAGEIKKYIQFDRVYAFNDYWPV
jgi:hypothetical protein